MWAFFSYKAWRELVGEGDMVLNKVSSGNKSNMQPQLPANQVFLTNCLEQLLTYPGNYGKFSDTEKFIHHR